MYLGKSSWTFVAIIRYWHGLHSDSVAHRLHAVLWSRTCRMEQALVIVPLVHTFHPSRSFISQRFFLVRIFSANSSSFLFCEACKRSLCVSLEPAIILAGGRRGTDGGRAGALMGEISRQKLLAGYKKERYLRTKI